MASMVTMAKASFDLEQIHVVRRPAELLEQPADRTDGCDGEFARMPGSGW